MLIPERKYRELEKKHNDLIRVCKIKDEYIRELQKYIQDLKKELSNKQ